MTVSVTPLEVASQVANLISTAKNPSLSEYTQSTRLAPTVLIDKTVVGLEQKYLNGLLQTLLSIYAGYYLTAVNLTMNVGNINVVRLLDQFSTDRSLVTSIGNSIWWANEDITSTQTYLPDFSTIGLEADDIELPPSYANNSTYLETFGGNITDRPLDNKDNIHNITDASNLAVGKLIEVKIGNGNAYTTIPINIVLAPKLIDPEDFVTISEHLNKDKSWMGRYHAVRSGQIKFIADYLLAFDLIEASYKAQLADKTGTLLMQQKRQSKGLLASILSGKISPNAISTMVIISKTTASRLEATLGGRLTNSSVRMKYFKNNATMMLIVIDMRMERFIIYQRGIADYTELTLEDVVNNAKKANGIDIGSIVSAYKLGSAPTL